MRDLRRARGPTPQTKDLRFLQRRVYFFCMAGRWKTWVCLFTFEFGFIASYFQEFKTETNMHKCNCFRLSRWMKSWPNIIPQTLGRSPFHNLSKRSLKIKHPKKVTAWITWFMNIAFVQKNKTFYQQPKLFFFRRIRGVSGEAVQCDIPTKSRNQSIQHLIVDMLGGVLLFCFFYYSYSLFWAFLVWFVWWGCHCCLIVYVCLVVFLNQSKPNNTPNVIEIVFDFVWIWLCLCLCDIGSLRFAVEKISEQWLVESILYLCKFGVIIAIITIVIACSR